MERIEVVRRRRWPWVISLGIVTVLVGLLGAIAWINHGNVERWEQAAAQSAEERDDALDHADDLAEQIGVFEDHIDEVEEALTTSESDVADLEGRLGDVANEKALVEDERETITAQADRIAEIAAAYDELAEVFSECVEAQSTFTEMMVDFGSYWQTGQEDLVHEQARYTGQTCADAEIFLADIRRYVNALAR